MALALCIIICSFLLASYADIAQTSVGNDIVERQIQPTTTVDAEPELLDVVLLASVDGQFRALNRTSGHTIWSMSSSASSERIGPASALAPLVRTIHPQDQDDDEQEIYVIEPQSGDIYVMATPSSPLERFPFSMSQLVDLSPFSFTDTDNPRVFVGKKETSLLVVELETGRIKATLNSACPWDPFEELQQLEDQIDLDELEGSQKPTVPTEILIGRTDYHITIFPKSKAQRTPIQNLSFSTYGPNNQDNLAQASYGRTMDGRYIQSLTDSHVFSFQAMGNGDRSEPLWFMNCDSPVIAVFDVLRKPSARPSSPAHTFVLLQPRPSVQDLEALSVYKASLPEHHSAYVGIVEETGSLFAMSPARYPLVSFDQNRDTIYGTIDPPTVLPDDVDEVTRRRKEREQRTNPYGTCQKTDERRCLVGLRPLRGDWLLDGAPVNGLPSNNLPPTNESHEPAPSPPEVVIEEPKTISKPSILPRTLVTAILLICLSLWLALGRSRRELVSEPRILAAATLKHSSETSVPESLVQDINMSDPPLDPTASSSTKPPPLVLVENAHDDAELSDRDGDDDAEATPVSGKRRPRRGRRGNKKKRTATEDKQEEVSDQVPPVDSPLIPSTAKPITQPSLIVSDVVLGFGSHGTVVYQGSLQGRAVAVKRLLQDFVTLASREVSILQESDDHPNVIRYYYQEAHANFLYIALELCPASLADIIECPDRDQFRDLAITFEPKRALKEIASGLRHLHSLKLIHRDIKPQNILVSFPKSSSSSRSGYRMLISDFGLCKKLDVDQTSFLPTAYGAMAAGTVGWRAPEILRGEVKLDEVNDDQSSSSSIGSQNGSVPTSAGRPTRLTKSVDIFALGCLFYYTMTNGLHPFGDRYEREVNILKDAKNLEALARFGEEGSEAVDLISQMLDPEAGQRPDTTSCLLHPFFWDPGRRLNFLQDASDRFEIMCKDPRDPTLSILETDAPAVVGSDWQARVDKMFLDNLGKFRKYDGRSVQDLLRALRNKKHHYQDLPDSVKRHLGAMPDGYLAYFTRRYPKLFLHVHSVISETTLRTESMFRSYFELPD